MSFVLINVIYKSQVECCIAISFSVRIRYQEQEQNRDINVVLFPICNNVGDLRIVSGVGAEGISDLSLNISAGGSRSGWDSTGSRDDRGWGSLGFTGVVEMFGYMGCNWQWLGHLFGNNAVVASN